MVYYCSHTGDNTRGCKISCLVLYTYIYIIGHYFGLLKRLIYIIKSETETESERNCCSLCLSPTPAAAAAAPHQQPLRFPLVPSVSLSLIHVSRNFNFLPGCIAVSTVVSRIWYRGIHTGYGYEMQSLCGVFLQHATKCSPHILGMEGREGAQKLSGRSLTMMVLAVTACNAALVHFNFYGCLLFGTYVKWYFLSKRSLYICAHMLEFDPRKRNHC